jgi:hypothetical protein
LSSLIRRKSEIGASGHSSFEVPIISQPREAFAQLNQPLPKVLEHPAPVKAKRKAAKQVPATGPVSTPFPTNKSCYIIKEKPPLTSRSNHKTEFLLRNSQDHFSAPIET